MAKPFALCFSCVLWVTFMAALAIKCSATDEERQVYIVYMGSIPQKEYSISSQHFSILQDVLEDSLVTDSLVRSYKRSFNGFAAKLTDHERQKLESMEGVVSVFPSRTLELHTTRSWDFMGFPETVKRQPTVESDVIVGVIDTGIWPESESFNDEGFGPPPKKWKGVCNGGQNFTCNNKLIGARYYKSSMPTDETARDVNGHGSHTASTAAGNHVNNASFYGLGQGTARGGVPSARLAVYKVCFSLGCDDASILAAFDDAIADGVDIITISLGPSSVAPFIHDTISIGAFHAMQTGILTVQSAGNNGPEFSTVTSSAPWILSVAASTIDRHIVDNITLNNGKTLIGNSVNSFEMEGPEAPLVYGKDVTRYCGESGGQVCEQGCLDNNLVKGKIVICNDSFGAQEANRAGSLGFIAKETLNDHSSIVPLPGTTLNDHDFEILLSYINSTKAPQAKLSRSEQVKNKHAPCVVSFSSRGPNTVVPEILKPDISAPGVEILAAYSPVASPSDDPLDKRSVKYSILSGTSMSCPHTAGAAAYIKSFHPSWSPSAIKSALMTTAAPMNETEKLAWEFAYGSGHINPVKALNPGLVYETNAEDYLQMLCSIGYNASTLRLITGSPKMCPEKNQTKTSPKDLNYPSMAARVKAKEPFKVEFPRTVRNVGSENSTYKVKVTSSSWIDVRVEPNVLSFQSLNEKKSFVVTVSGKDVEAVVSTTLVWSDGIHSVHSPVVIYAPLTN